MKRRRLIATMLCLLAITGGRPTPAPVILQAQETPRTDPTASAPDSAQRPPPSTRPTTLPATRPAALSLAERFPVLRGKEGFWRVGQDAAGVWWFISPHGEAEFLNTVTTVQPALKGRQTNAAEYQSRDWNPNAPDAEKELERWAEKTLARVREVGFKGLGAWSHPVLHKFDVPMTRDLNVWTWLKERSVRLYSPQWAEQVEATIKTQVEPLRENRHLVGYFTDNELDWSDTAVGPGVYFDGLTRDDPNRAMVVKILRQTWPTLTAFNADWKTDFQDWNELDKWQTLPREPAGAYAKLGSAWLLSLATDYFRVTSDLLRKHDPNHLNLGVRFRGYLVPEVVAAARTFTDALSLNYYVADAMLDKAMFTKAYELSGQPLIVTEYSFHALDGRSGNRNTVGFPAQVLDQQARGEAYKLFTTRASRVPYVIGADWFQWMDEPPSGRRDDGEDANFGVVDVDDRPYEGLAAAIRATTPLLNALHGQSPSDDHKDIWRDAQEAKPTVKVPYLTTAPRLNGELTDWPAAAKLKGVRTVHAVGSERIKLSPPNMYLGWREEGIYVAFEVFDDHVAAAPADGWWWSKDCLEFWIATTAPAPGQMTYNADDHHFYFVPVDFPSRDGVNGVVGQWYAPGSAIPATLMPHPLARTGVRILADRYVAEIFIPAKALHGFDPAKQGVMAFNASVRNAEIAAEYYWSSPKLAVTQARPGSWGTIYLEPRQQETPIAGAVDKVGGAVGD